MTGNANAVSVLVDSAGQLGTISSSKSVKHDIEDMGDASLNILNLRPVVFVYNGDKNNTKQYGLIAEEANEIFPEIVVKDKKDQLETIQYHVLPILLLNEVKKQHMIIADQQLTIDKQDRAIKNLIITVEDMNTAILSLQNRVQGFIGDL